LKTLLPNAILATERKDGIEPIVFAIFDWIGFGRATYATKNFGGIKGRILNISALGSSLRSDNSGSVSAINISLDDSDGEMKAAFDNGNLEDSVCRISIFYDGLFTDSEWEALTTEQKATYSQATQIYKGKVTGPFVWRDGDRILDVQVETKIKNGDVGYAVKRGEYTDIPDFSLDKVWPIVFGKCTHVPGVLVVRAPTTTLRSSVKFVDPSRVDRELYKDLKTGDGYIDLEPDDEAQIESIIKEEEIKQGTGINFVNVYSDVRKNSTIYLEDSSNFPRDKEIKIIIQGAVFKGIIPSKSDPDAGIYNSDIGEFKVTEANCAKYVDVKFGPRVIGDPDEHNVRVAWLKDDLHIFQHTCHFKQGDIIGSDVSACRVMVCVRQEGRKVWFDNMARLYESVGDFQYKRIDASDKISAVRGLPFGGLVTNTHEIINEIKEVLKQRAKKNKQKAKDPYFLLKSKLKQLQLLQNLFWNAQAGEPVYLWEGDIKDKFIVNQMPSVKVHAVYGRRENDTEGYKKLINKRHYKVNLAEPTNAEYPLNQLTTIEFTEPLKSLGYSEEIYVTLTSTLSENLSDQIKWILQTYTDLNIDEESFGEVASLVTKYPANWALLQQKDSLTLASEIAWQGRCGLIFDSEEVKIRYLSKEKSSTFSFTTANVEADSLELTLTEQQDLYTQTTCDWRQDYLHGEWDKNDSYKYHYKHNVDLYGLIDQSRDIYIYNHESLVKKTIDFWGYRYANVWKRITVKGFHDAFSLEVFDVVQINLGEILWTIVKGVVESVSHDLTSGECTVTLWLPITAGHVTKDSNAWSDDFLDVIPHNPAEAVETESKEIWATPEPDAPDTSLFLNPEKALAALESIRPHLRKNFKVTQLNPDKPDAFIGNPIDGVDENGKPIEGSPPVNIFPTNSNARINVGDIIEGAPIDSDTVVVSNSGRDVDSIVAFASFTPDGAWVEAKYHIIENQWTFFGGPCLEDSTGLNTTPYEATTNPKGGMLPATEFFGVKFDDGVVHRVPAVLVPIRNANGEHQYLWFRPPQLETVFAVKLVMTSGTAGTGSAASSYVYTVKRLSDDFVLGINKSPVAGRSVGSTAAATYGLAYISYANELVLLQAFEPLNTVGCP
jgi:hypothetical protein